MFLYIFYQPKSLLEEEMGVTKVSVTLQITKPIKWRPWKGLFAGKVVYDAFSSLGIEPTFPFRVSPPEKFKKAMKGGEQVSFDVHFWGPEAEEAAGKLLEGLLLLDYVSPLRGNVVSVEEEFTEPEGSEEPYAVYFTIEHDPTYYRYHGAYVPFPSPKRMMFSLFRRIDEAFGTDTRELASVLGEKIEVIGGSFEKKKYAISHGQEVPAFSGKVAYYGILTEKEALALERALRLAKHLGLGQGPGMGFGNVREVIFKPPSFDTPVKKWAPQLIRRAERKSEPGAEHEAEDGS